jgi:hypothetical protein
MLTVNFRQPSHKFTFGVGMCFISYPLALTPLARIGVRCDRTVAPKGGRLRNRTGGHGLKML